MIIQPSYLFLMKQEFKKLDMSLIIWNTFRRNRKLRCFLFQNHFYLITVRRPTNHIQTFPLANTRRILYCTIVLEMLTPPITHNDVHNLSIPANPYFSALPLLPLPHDFSSPVPSPIISRIPFSVAHISTSILKNAMAVINRQHRVLMCHNKSKASIYFILL